MALQPDQQSHPVSVAFADGTTLSMAIEWHGETSFSLVFPPAIDTAIHALIQSIFHHLRAISLPFVTDIIPAYHTITVVFDPTALPSQLPDTTAGEQVLQEILQCLPSMNLSSNQEKRLMRIPVCYDPSLGPDLVPLAQQLNMTPEELIHLHSSITYQVFMLGFLPGFAYMGPIDSRLICSRLERPRTSVPAGSVGIAGSQTGIYPVASPGGWQLIGKTPLQLFTPHQLPPCLLQPGDEVIMYPISLDAFKKWSLS